MPLYEYRCEACRSTFELLRPMSRSTERAECPRGHQGATRTISLVAERVRGDAFAGAPAAGCACGGACSCGGH